MGTISERIGIVIESKAKTKTEFANRLNVTPAYISKILNKGSTPSDRLIKDICNKYDISEKWLTTGEGKMDAEKTLEQDIASFLADLPEDRHKSRKALLLRAMTKLTDEQWELLADIAEMYVAEMNKK